MCFHLIVVLSDRKKTLQHPLDSQDGEDLSGVQLGVVELSDEDSGDALENGRPVHVNGGPDGKDEAADAFVHAVVLLHTFDHGGKSCRTGEKKRAIEHNHIFISHSGESNAKHSSSMQTSQPSSHKNDHTSSKKLKYN